MFHSTFVSDKSTGLTRSLFLLAAYSPVTVSGEKIMFLGMSYVYEVVGTQLYK